MQMEKSCVQMGKKEVKLWDKEVKSEDTLWQVEEYQAQGKRPSMEDASVVLKNFGDTKSNLFCAVFDGHFGNRFLSLISFLNFTQVFSVLGRKLAFYAA
jgi:serine/threonine protein phosphatase PrpC